MFDHYEKQGTWPGRTIPHEVTELVNNDGTHPIVHIEHLGRTNPSLMQWMIGRAGEDKDAPKVEINPDDREMIATHCARRLERVFRGDGTLATDDDIGPFIRAMPPLAFERMVLRAMDARNFCEFPIIGDPKAIAEK